VILNRVKEGKGSFGYNAAKGEFGDMLDAGILDPTKVTRLALQNAASVAGLLLTTEVMVAEAPKDEEHSHGALKLLRGKHWKPVAAEFLYLLSSGEGSRQREGNPRCFDWTLMGGSCRAWRVRIK